MKRMEKTPLKRSPGKGMIVLRSSPRKRLQLSDTPPKELLESRRVCLVHNVWRGVVILHFSDNLKKGYQEFNMIFTKIPHIKVASFCILQVSISISDF